MKHMRVTLNASIHYSLRLIFVILVILLVDDFAGPEVSLGLYGWPKLVQRTFSLKEEA